MLGISLFSFVALVAAGVVGMRKIIPPNKFSGVRTPETMDDPDIWYRANEYAGRLMVWCGLLFGLVGLSLYFIHSIDDDAYAVAITIVTVLFLAILGFKVPAYVRVLTAAKSAETEETGADQN